MEQYSWESCEKAQVEGISSCFNIVARSAEVQMLRLEIAFPGYELLHRLGEGGTGEVWKARRIKLNRIVALKRLKGGGRVGPTDLIRFLAGAEVSPELMQALLDRLETFVESITASVDQAKQHPHLFQSLTGLHSKPRRKSGEAIA